MSAATRLTADRGHGLSPRQKQILADVANGEAFRAYTRDLRRTHTTYNGYGAVGTTIAALERLGLVELPPAAPDAPVWFGAPMRVWRLTDPDGITLAARMGLVERTCDTCGTPETAWDVTHPLHLEGSSQCPLCSEADCAEEAKYKRRTDV